MKKFRLPSLALLTLMLSLGATRAQDPTYEIAIVTGTLVKVDLGKKLTLTPTEMGKAGKQLTLEVTPDSVFLEASAVTVAGKTGAAVKAIKAADLPAGQKQAVSVVYAKVGDRTQLLALVATGGKSPKGFVVDGVRGVLNKVNQDKSITMQPFLDNKFGKQEDVAILAGSKFFEMAPGNAKKPYVVKSAKATDLTANRRAIAVLFARVNDMPSVLAVIAQPTKEK